MTFESGACPPAPARPTSSSSSHPRLQKPLGVLSTSQGKRRRVPPHPLLPAARTSPAEPGICIPLSLPPTWGGIKGKVTRACLIKGLCTETQAGGGEGRACAGALVGEEPASGAAPSSWSPAPRPAAPGAPRCPTGLPEGGPGYAPARGDSNKAGLSTRGRLERALLTIFGLARRQLGRPAANCLLECGPCPKSASVVGNSVWPTGALETTPNHAWVLRCF